MRTKNLKRLYADLSRLNKLSKNGFGSGRSGSSTYDPRAESSSRRSSRNARKKGGSQASQDEVESHLNECMICTNELTGTVGQHTIGCPQCSKKFHKGCLCTWVTNKSNCPNCRADLSQWKNFICGKAKIPPPGATTKELTNSGLPARTTEEWGSDPFERKKYKFGGLTFSRLFSSQQPEGYGDSGDIYTDLLNERIIRRQPRNTTLQTLYIDHVETP